jgi:predicted cobalt transporter CbtA
MTARAFLVRGLLAGLLAGFATFLVAHQLGEPHLEAALALEAAPASGDAHAHTHGAEAEAHSHDGEALVVSRGNQRTWGLLTGSLGIGTALGGLVALVAAGVAGRLGRLRVAQSTALVALIGFVSVGLVPFLKYPGNPPSVGDPNTIGDRTSAYFAFLVISVLVAAAATALGARLWPRLGTYRAVLLGVVGYVVVVAAAAALMPTVNEVGDFPADTLWYFRRASLLTLAALWATIGILLTGFLGRLEQRETAIVQRRALAASL